MSDDQPDDTTHNLMILSEHKRNSTGNYEFDMMINGKVVKCETLMAFHSCPPKKHSLFKQIFRKK